MASNPARSGATQVPSSGILDTTKFDLDEILSSGFDERIRLDADTISINDAHRAPAGPSGGLRPWGISVDRGAMRISQDDGAFGATFSSPALSRSTSDPIVTSIDPIAKRSLIVSGVGGSISDAELYEMFGGKETAIKSFHASTKSQGFIVIEFFDTRAAQFFKTARQGAVVDGNTLDIVYASTPGGEWGPSPGLLVVSGPPLYALLPLLSKFGDIKFSGEVSAPFRNPSFVPSPNLASLCPPTAQPTPLTPAYPHRRPVHPMHVHPNAAP